MGADHAIIKATAGGERGAGETPIHNSQDTILHWITGVQKIFSSVKRLRLAIDMERLQIQEDRFSRPQFVHRNTSPNT